MMEHNHSPAPTTGQSCCAPAINRKTGVDVVLWGSLAVMLGALGGSIIFPSLVPLHDFATSILELLRSMWIGIVIGVVLVGLMSQVPREYFQSMMGRGHSVSGIARAMIAGVLLDLCSHGILLIGAKLYERGVSLPQVMAFLIASPWNSFSLTIILISLIGLPWTLVFIAGSCVIAFVTGLIYMALIKKGILADNPNTIDIPSDFNLKHDAQRRLKTFRPNAVFFKNVAWAGIKEGQMLVRWLLLGIIIAAALKAFVPSDHLSIWFGPTLIGLAVTLVAATIIEVCSEGSAPIASVILNKAGAPGNAFAFLMAGVSTDYTEMMIIRQMTGSWKIALSLPLVTVPQIILLAIIMNNAL